VSDPLAVILRLIDEIECRALTPVFVSDAMFPSQPRVLSFESCGCHFVLAGTAFWHELADRCGSQFVAGESEFRGIKIRKLDRHDFSEEESLALYAGLSTRPGYLGGKPPPPLDDGPLFR
jgi:hypothetical protein